MPRGKRQRIKDHALAAQNDSDRALMRLLRLRDIFAPHHPEFIPLLEALAQMQIMFQVSLGDFFEQAWGSRPDVFPNMNGPTERP